MVQYIRLQCNCNYEQGMAVAFKVIILLDTVLATLPSPGERKVGSLSAGDISPPRLLLSGAEEREGRREAESETERENEREIRAKSVIASSCRSGGIE